MRISHRLQVLALVLLALLGVSACEPPVSYTPPPPSYYYVTSSTSYLRDCPSYDCGVVTMVFAGDRVILMDRNDFGWSRVQLDRSGAVGWIPSDLLSYSPLPSTYYVTSSTVYMRDCADYNCRARELLRRGDRVDKLDEDYRGWWRVVSLKSGAQGWLPAYSVSYRPGPPYYYVAIGGLSLRSGPSTGSRILYTLALNDQVEMLGSGPSGWVQVRDIRTNIIGWVAGRYLETFPVRYSKPAPKKRKAPSGREAPEEAPVKPGPKAM